MPPRPAPFVLLDDARTGRATLFRDSVGVVRAARVAEVMPALEAVRAGTARGLHAAGWLAYDAGQAFEPGLRAAAPDGPLLWFGLFKHAEPLDADARAALLGDPAGAWAGPPRPRVGRDRYAGAFARVREWIAAGDIYQANLSFRADVGVAGPPPALYARLAAASAAGWGALVWDGARWLLSCSPEQFFRLDGDRLEARPMKGTGPRGPTPAADDGLAAALAADPKQRAENLMIVDLLRNDLARVAVPGSVAVPSLFAVERFPTVQQLVSVVAARLAPGRDAVDVLAALFPCGSVTGAPKRRAMEVIDAVEADGRGPYTGAIGRIGPDGGAAFSVAIRILVLEDGADAAELGLGSGVVADSAEGAEWAECLAKGAFVTAAPPPPDLIETLRFDPDDGLVELEAHVARLDSSACALGFRFNRHGLRNDLHAATFRLVAPARVRVRVSPGGAVAVETGPLPPPPAGPLLVRLVPLPVDPRDLRVRHKTADRAFYDEARAGADEALFHLPDGRLTEGSFTSLFVARDGRLVTPPLALGLQAGVLRATLLAAGRAVEGELTAADVRAGFLLGNIVRGLLPARLA